ncbi:DUF2523 domain-containing protein [Burkholderia sp. Ac-20392]|uniref:DUF2523 domain-containing protein n=1 Tax=Burkholderia sp. Ac-20392 TaxID=2703905 RepID=UPI00197EDADC|nr:DUF2523 domain-containing protein [Burkholderia sp. Ac-20392]MBN3796302.1 DUF2523 domain-containing protein [Burkholderia sp. Ac-20392]
MWALLASAVNLLLGFVVRSVIAKFFAYFVMYFITTEFIAVLQSSGLLPTAASLSGAFGGIGADVWYFLDLCAFSFGVQLIVAAFATRFIIRRIPVIG